MPTRVEIISKAEVFRKWIFRIEEVRLRHERYDGGLSREYIRLNLDRGDSVAAVVHDPAADVIMLAEQFRYPAYEKGPGWILELPAGVVDPSLNETPEQTMRRELAEEIGYQVQNFRHISTFYLSPGGSSERIYLYYAQVTPQDRTGSGGGVEQIGEDIRRVALAVDEALAMVRRGEIVDAKTIIGLQWLKENRSAPAG
jgi:ADP-ribose pyrophosphatase